MASIFQKLSRSSQLLASVNYWCGGRARAKIWKAAFLGDLYWRTTVWPLLVVAARIVAVLVVGGASGGELTSQTCDCQDGTRLATRGALLCPTTPTKGNEKCSQLPDEAHCPQAHSPEASIPLGASSRLVHLSYWQVLALLETGERATAMEAFTSYSLAPSLFPGDSLRESGAGCTRRQDARIFSYSAGLLAASRCTLGLVLLLLSIRHDPARSLSSSFVIVLSSAPVREWVRERQCAVPTSSSSPDHRDKCTFESSAPSTVPARQCLSLYPSAQPDRDASIATHLVLAPSLSIRFATVLYLKLHTLLSSSTHRPSLFHHHYTSLSLVYFLGLRFGEFANKFGAQWNCDSVLNFFIPSYAKCVGPVWQCGAHKLIIAQPTTWQPSQL